MNTHYNLNPYYLNPDKYIQIVFFDCKTEKD